MTATYCKPYIERILEGAACSRGIQIQKQIHRQNP
jgi:hypothetical protein